MNLQRPKKYNYNISLLLFCSAGERVIELLWYIRRKRYIVRRL
jgi:hypothetical protein